MRQFLLSAKVVVCCKLKVYVCDNQKHSKAGLGLEKQLRCVSKTSKSLSVLHEKYAVGNYQKHLFTYVIDGHLKHNTCFY